MSDQSKYVNKLANKKVLIIGGSSGIGYAVAEPAVESGAAVFISSSQESRVHSALSRLRTSYPTASSQSRIHGFSCDLHTPGDKLESSINTLFTKLATKLDHIVFTAGDSVIHDSLDSLTYARAVQSGHVRFFAPLFVAKVGSQFLNPGPESSITLTSGAVMEKPPSGWTVPAAFSMGLVGMVRGLAVELKPLRVNLVSPGPAVTEMWTDAGPEMEAMIQGVGSALLTGRAGRPEDVAEAYLHAMRDSNLTAANCFTHGGFPLVSLSVTVSTPLNSPWSDGGTIQHACQYESGRTYSTRHDPQVYHTLFGLF